MYSCVCVVFVCLCYVYFAHSRLLQLVSIVCLVGCGLVSCDTTLVTKFLERQSHTFYRRQHLQHIIEHVRYGWHFGERNQKHAVCKSPS